MDEYLEAPSVRSTPVVERRRHERLGTCFIGAILLNGIEIEQCVITNLSPSGAEIRRYFPDGLPDKFQLKLAIDLMVRARVIWQNDLRAGLEFEYGTMPARPHN